MREEDSFLWSFGSSSLIVGDGAALGLATSSSSGDDVFLVDVGLALSSTCGGAVTTTDLGKLLQLLVSNGQVRSGSVLTSQSLLVSGLECVLDGWVGGLEALDEQLS